MQCEQVVWKQTEGWYRSVWALALKEMQKQFIEKGNLRAREREKSLVKSLVDWMCRMVGVGEEIEDLTG